MRNSTITILVVVGLVVLLLIGILAGRVGGIAIRSNATQSGEATIEVVQPLAPGVPTQLHITVPERVSADEELLALYRAGGEEHAIGQAAAGVGVLTIVIPCALAEDVGTIVLRRLTNDEVLGTASVDLLPVGPDCL